MPLRVGKYPRGTQDEERRALYNAVLTLGKDGGAVMPEGTSIDFVETHMRGELPQPPLVEACDFQISKAILGGTLTTESGDRGARSLGEVHERNETDIAEDDGPSLCETLRRDLFRPLVLFNLGDYPIPHAEFPSEEQEDLLERAQRDKILIKELGLPVKLRQVYDTYGWEEPGESDDLLEPPRSEPSRFVRGEDEDEDEPTAREQRAARLLRLSLDDVRALRDAKKKSRAWAI
jgi:phage gp29-like protein